MSNLPNITTLRHPQLLDPPSRCPNCGNKSWDRYTPDHVEPEYHCVTCQWPTVKPKWTRHQLHEIALVMAIGDTCEARYKLATSKDPNDVPRVEWHQDLLAALEAERERWKNSELPL